MYPDIFWNIIRKKVFERDRYTCQYCGSIKNLTVDHVWPRSKGGKNNMSNLVTCCSRCNARKGNKTLREWIEGKDSVASDLVEIEIPPKNNNTIKRSAFGVAPKKLIMFFNEILDGERITQTRWVGAGRPLSRSEFDTARDKLIELGVLEWKNEDTHAQGVCFSVDGRERLSIIRDEIVSPKLPIRTEIGEGETE